MPCSLESSSPATLRSRSNHLQKQAEAPLPSLVSLHRRFGLLRAESSDRKLLTFKVSTPVLPKPPAPLAVSVSDLVRVSPALTNARLRDFGALGQGDLPHGGQN